MNADWYHQALSLGTALACGLLIGVERGWKLREQEPGSRVAGIRTFSMLGLCTGVAGLVARLGHPFVAAAIVLGAVALLVAAYARQLETQHDATSAVAAMVTVAIGFLAGIGEPALAIASAAVAVALLALRTELHGFVDRLDEDDVKALARYAIIAGAILPFLPSGQYGPLGAWNPQKLWLVVVLVTGFSFLGYVANRIFGERNGTIATAVIGGAVQLDRGHPGAGAAARQREARGARSRPGSRWRARSCTCASLSWSRSWRRARWTNL